MNSVRANVSNFEYPVFPQFSLQCQIPLLRVGCNEFSRYNQSKNKIGLNAWTITGIISGLSRVASGEVLEDSQTRNESGIDYPGLRQGVDVRAGTGAPGPKATGKNGAWKLSWSAVPTSSRT